MDFKKQRSITENLPFSMKIRNCIRKHPIESSRIANILTETLISNIFFIPYFQNFLAANSQCWWNTPLTAATRSLKYAGHVAPGMLLVTAEPCALEILRGAYARSVLKPPATYVISSVGKFNFRLRLWWSLMSLNYNESGF